MMMQVKSINSKLDKILTRRLFQFKWAYKIVGSLCIYAGIKIKELWNKTLDMMGSKEYGQEQSTGEVEDVVAVEDDLEDLLNSLVSSW
ncbi:hypothetical protein ACP70R_037882 [Stipagrostis hirtigluma subsp. patula]